MQKCKERMWKLHWLRDILRFMWYGCQQKITKARGTCSAHRGYKNYIQNCIRKSKTEDIIRSRRRWRDNIQWTSRHRMNQYNGFIYFRTAIYNARRKQKVNGAPCYKQCTVLNKHNSFSRSVCQQNGLLLHSVDRASWNDSCYMTNVTHSSFLCIYFYF